MDDLPSFAQLVSDVAASVAFYTEKLGFSLQDSRPTEDMAVVLDPDGDALLLAGPAVQHPATYLSEHHLIFHPGDSLDFHGEDLEALRAAWISRGVAAAAIQLKERRSGARVLSVEDPDHYVLKFIRPPELSATEILALYAQGPEQLEAALEGLAEADLDLGREGGGWSIRQIVHHVADTDILFGETMKVALSAPGAAMTRPRAVGNERISTAPEYNKRPIGTSIQLFRVFHEYILELVRYVPDVNACYVVDAEGRRHAFSSGIAGIVVEHTEEHLEEIWAIRHKYGQIG
jgi:catechol 2,3-dioxygenase-like lactoylglutathione lyase family enzyme